MALLLRYSSLIGLLLAFLLLHRSSAENQPPATCTDDLVKFSPCLSYVSSPPNNLSDVVPSRCCESFSSAFDTGEAICLCYLLQEPRIFGFPIDEARVLSLSSVCPLRNDSSARNGSLQSLCSGSQTLPPLYSATISGISGPSASGPDNESSPEISTPPQPKNSSFPPEVALKPPTPPDSPVEEEVPSSAAKNQFCYYFSCLVPGILIFLFFPFPLFLCSFVKGSK